MGNIPKGADVNQGKTLSTVSDDSLREQEDAFTPKDIIDRETGNDFWDIYKVERCGI